MQIKCPICSDNLLPPSDNMAGGTCVACNRNFTTDELSAIANSVRMQAVAINERVVKITNGDGRQIRTIFHKEDRSYNRDRIVWIITNAQKYAYVPCIRSALKALRQQHVMWT